MEEKLKSNIISSELALNLRFALGNTYENLGNFKKSFKHYEEGNKIQNLLINFDLKKEEYILRVIKQSFSKEIINKISKNHTNNIKPIFILGMPRSGTSLPEKIISSHSRIYGGGELS
tara:strand:- start:110 stop:463 length:354 start_codon:yes stop_codon:yes gene_type:complete